MKIMSSKKYEELSQQLVDLGMDNAKLFEDEKTYISQVNYLRDALSKIDENLMRCNNDLAKLECDNDDLKKEIKRLKTLLTKNKIDYKKENKNGKRN